MKLQAATLARLLGVIASTGATAVWLVLLSRQSQDRQILSRYSPDYFVLLVSMAALVVVCWWLTLNPGRLMRAWQNFRSLPILPILIVSFSLIFLLDLLVDAAILIALLPVVPAAGLGLLGALDSAESPARVSRLRAPLTSAAVLLSSLVIGLIGFEVIFRTILLEERVPNTQEEFERIISSAWPEDGKPDDGSAGLRLLGLADSFGRFGGFGNYHYLLEEDLLAAGFQAKMINFSVSAYAPIDELTLLRRFADEYDPDLVLHGFFVGNDFIRRGQTLAVYGEIPIERTRGISSFRPRYFLSIQWLQRYLVVLQDQRQRSLEAAADPTQGTFSQETFLAVERDKLELFRREYDAADRWQHTLTILDQIRTECEQMGAQYVLIIHPDQLQVDHQLLQQLQAHYDLDLDLYDLRMPQDYLMAHCQEHQIPCLDLLPAFRASAEQGSLYATRDTHYGPEGNQLAAAAIAAFLQEHVDALSGP